MFFQEPSPHVEPLVHTALGYLARIPIYNSHSSPVRCGNLSASPTVEMTEPQTQDVKQLAQGEQQGRDHSVSPTRSGLSRQASWLYQRH